MRIVHAADLHLDSPLRGLARLDDDDVAHQLRLASRRALERLVALVLDERADVLVLAGDIYDGDWPDYATGRFFAQQMAVLHDHGIPVVTAAGNHDAESRITLALTLPPNVRVLSTEQPETVVFDDLGLAVHGQGYPERAVTDNLALAYPEPLRHQVNVGLLHTAVAGAAGHERYAPCSPADLERLDYDYFALGHVHQHRLVLDGDRVAAFSGNLQGRHPKETGPKGALVVDVEPGARASLRHVPLDVARWVALDVDTTGTASLDEVLDRLDRALRDAAAGAGGRLLVACVHLVGTTGAAPLLADPARLREEVSLVAERAGATLARARSSTRAPAERAGVDPELVESVRRAGEALLADPQLLAPLAGPVANELGRPLRTVLDLASNEVLGQLASDAVTGLLARLAGSEQ